MGRRWRCRCWGPTMPCAGRADALQAQKPTPSANDHLRILLAIADKIGASIENAAKYQDAADSATTDYLTGLPNARSLFLQLDSEISRCQRESGRLAVMLCDLDGFKQVNDQFGHMLGNQVLQAFADRLKLALPGVRLRFAHGRRRVRGHCARPEAQRCDKSSCAHQCRCSEQRERNLHGHRALRQRRDRVLSRRHDSGRAIADEADKRMYAMKKDHPFAASLPAIPSRSVVTQ